MAQPNRRNLYRDNGAAAYDVYAWNDQTARQYDDNRAYERTLPIELPDERAYEQAVPKSQGQNGHRAVYTGGYADGSLSHDPCDFRLCPAV